MKRILGFLWLICQIFILPISIIEFIRYCVSYNRYRKIISNAINHNDELFKYLDTLDFNVDWIGRLYSLQAIPSELRDFSEDELYDITMRSLLPLHKLIERTVLVDVCAVIINRISDEAYVICITPYIYPAAIKSLRILLASIVIYIITFMILYLTNIL